jgi:hypothetical protein
LVEQTGKHSAAHLKRVAVDSAGVKREQSSAALADMAVDSAGVKREQSSAALADMDWEEGAKPEAEDPRNGAPATGASAAPRVPSFKLNMDL